MHNITNKRIGVDMNKRYEYKTLECEEKDKFNPPHQPKESKGWIRIYADIMLEGVFIVYRRSKIKELDKL